MFKRPRFAVDMNDRSEDPKPTEQPRAAVIKRRWAIVRRATGGTAVLAVAGALALGDPELNTDEGQTPVGGESHISAQA